MIEHLLGLLASAVDAERQRGAELAVGLFDAARGAPWPEPMGAFSPEELEPANLERVRDALVVAARLDLRAPSAGLAIWALGKRHEPTLRLLFLEALAANAGAGAGGGAGAGAGADADAGADSRAGADVPPAGNPGVLHQALIALHNLDEPSLAEVSSFSIHEVEQNRALARAVLAAATEG